MSDDYISSTMVCLIDGVISTEDNFLDIGCYIITGNGNLIATF
jgi:hypothetical protein